MGCIQTKEAKPAASAAARSASVPTSFSSPTSPSAGAAAPRRGSIAAGGSTTAPATVPDQGNTTESMGDPLHAVDLEAIRAVARTLAYPLSGTKSLSALFATDDAQGITAVKTWAKTAGILPDGMSLAHVVAFVEAVQKRRNVFVNGKKCGDDEHTAAERAMDGASAIIGTYLDAKDGPKYIGVHGPVPPSGVPTQVAAVDVADWLVGVLETAASAQDLMANPLGNVAVFDGLVAALDAYWAFLLTAAAQGEGGA
ncbi:hypothetical protein GGF31_008729 [Allomyces arbusculus]|nr:hypothetical protein GGF31_008729 [Allomyces arbusculus]